MSEPTDGADLDAANQIMREYLASNSITSAGDVYFAAGEFMTALDSTLAAYAMLAAENARLRAALDSIADRGCYPCSDEAREALK